MLFGCSNLTFEFLFFFLLRIASVQQSIEKAIIDDGQFEFLFL